MHVELLFSLVKLGFPRCSQILALAARETTTLAEIKVWSENTTTRQVKKEKDEKDEPGWGRECVELKTQFGEENIG